MGYTTNFSGRFNLNKPLTVAQKNYLEAFSQSRHMIRKGPETAELSDPIRTAVGLPVGEHGQYYVGDHDNMGQSNTPDIINFNSNPPGVPGLWCQWVPTQDGKGIEWDGGEKFYGYVEWLKYIIEQFLTPWGIAVEGEVFWEGEKSGDMGKIVVENSVVTTKKAKISY